MTIAINQVNATSDTFESWLTRTNQIATALSSVVMTTELSSGGAYNVGNAYTNGVFSANTLTVTQYLRGGTVASPANLAITTNTHFTDIANLSSNSTYLNLKSATGTLETTGTLTVSGTTVSITSNLNVKSNSLVVSTAGRVSINSATADAALSVTGTANVSGNVRIGSIATLAANVLIQGNTTLSVSGAETTGYLFFGNNGARALSYDGSKYKFGTANVTIEGALTCANVTTVGSVGIDGVDVAAFKAAYDARPILKVFDVSGTELFSM